MLRFRLCFLFITIFLNEFHQINAVNHWIVTQTGKIQAYLGTPFDLRRPYDLLALLDQETRRQEIDRLYDVLINGKNSIEDRWKIIQKNSETVSKITTQDQDCLAAGKIFPNIDLYGTIASNGTERGINIDLSRPNPEANSHYIEPICNNFGKVNIESDSSNKTNISIAPDKVLKYMFLPADIESLEEFGTLISEQLSKNCSSWVHYNLAALFWRMKGDGDQAVACTKLAIQHVTHGYRDIPLYNLAGILHLARFSKEAAQVLHSAVELAPNEILYYQALGNVYAALGDYTTSINYYKKYREFNPEQENSVANRHAIICYWKLLNGLTDLQGQHQSILTELHDYHSLQQQWMRLQERVMWEHASFELLTDNDFPGILKDNTEKVQRCVQKTSGNSDKPVISCSFYEESPGLEDLNLQGLSQFVENEKQKLTAQMGKYNEEQVVNPPLLPQKFPTSMSIKGNKYFDVTGWPKKEECLQWNLPANEEDDLDLPLFLPPENKGYQISKILSDYIDLPEGSQHPLPWYPPVCESDNVNGEKFIPLNHHNILDTELKSNEFLQSHLLKYVNGGKADEAEIGQRIITAMEKKAAPKWVLATLASLYWRVRGNTRKAMDCLDMAFQIVPKDSTDIVVVSMGSVIYQLGLEDQALKFATLAFKINYIEPSTNFLLALLHYRSDNPLLAMYYMKNVLRVEPEFYDGLAGTLLKSWGCRIKMGGYKYTMANNALSQQNCADGDTFKGEGVVCSNNGEQCKSATIHCFKKIEQENNILEMDRKQLEDTLCGGSSDKHGLPSVLMSSILGEGSGDLEPDQSRLETLSDDVKATYSQHVRHHFHMRLSVGEEHPMKEHEGLGDFFVSATLNEDPETENQLLIYDNHATYTLSAEMCKNTKLLQKFKYSSIWSSIVSRSIDISSHLKSLSLKDANNDLKPYCKKNFVVRLPNNMEGLIKRILNHKLPSSPEKDLIELLGLMANDQKMTEKEAGFKLAVALKQDELSWVLLTAASLYWRIVGNSEQSVMCMRSALTQVPEDLLDIPLLHFANFLNRVGFHRDALSVADLALKASPNFVLTHFTLANIHVSMGSYEKAVTFFRACLAMDSDFEPARVRLKAALCTLLFDENSAAASAAYKLMQNLN